MKSFLLASLVGAAVLAAPVIATAQGNPAVPKNPCVKPEEFPGKLATDQRRKSWQKSVDDYGACIKKYSADQRQIVEAAMKAGNDAVEEYNQFVAKAKDAIEKASQ